MAGNVLHISEGNCRHKIIIKLIININKHKTIINLSQIQLFIVVAVSGIPRNTFNQINMKKMLLFTAVMFGLFIFLIHSLTTSVTSEIKKERNKYEVKIGTKYVLEKDTLTVVDYSSIFETFTLSNGKTVNASLILKQK